MDENDEIQFHYPPGMDEYDYAYNHLIHRGYTQEQIEKWFEYDHNSKLFTPTKEFIVRKETISRLNRKAINLYYEAAKVGLGGLYLSNYVKGHLERKVRQKHYEAEHEDEMDDSDLHFNLTSKLGDRGLSTYIMGRFDEAVFSYTLHGHEFWVYDTLYFHDELLGIFYDDQYIDGLNGPRFPRQEHIDELLKIVKKENLRLLLVYWEENGEPVWEVYVNGVYIRRQHCCYSYEGFLFDEEKLADMNQIILDANGSGIDIGRTQKLLLDRVVDASQKISFIDELRVRIEENVRQHSELSNLVSLMQLKSAELSKAVQKMNVNGDISIEEQQKAYDLLDAYTESLPQVTVMDFKRLAREKFMAVFDRLSPSSQMYLTTAAALESVINDNDYDICPIYAELGRVLENELDLRIFSEYISRLKKLGKKKGQAIKEKQGKGPFQSIQIYLRNYKGGKLFIPESTKFGALPELLMSDTDNDSILKDELNAVLERNKYNKESLCCKEQNDINQAFVRSRNEHTHPNPNMNMELELINLEQFKQETIARLEWLTKATQSIETE